MISDGQARKEEPSDNKLFWNGIYYSLYIKPCVFVFLSVEMAANLPLLFS
jgi:hypothetical protein